MGVRDPLEGTARGLGVGASPPPRWLHDADHPVARLRRSWSGSITPIFHWLHYGDPGMAPLGRSVTALAGLLLTARNPMVDANLQLHSQHIGRLASALPEFDPAARSFQ